MERRAPSTVGSAIPKLQHQQQQQRVQPRGKPRERPAVLSGGHQAVGEAGKLRQRRRMQQQQQPLIDWDPRSWPQPREAAERLLCSSGAGGEEAPVSASPPVDASPGTRWTNTAPGQGGSDFAFNPEAEAFVFNPGVKAFWTFAGGACYQEGETEAFASTCASTTPQLFLSGTQTVAATRSMIDILEPLFSQCISDETAVMAEPAWTLPSGFAILPNMLGDWSTNSALPLQLR